MTGTRHTLRPSHCFQWFSSLWFQGFRRETSRRLARALAIGTTVFALAGCATTYHEFRPAPGTYFKIRVQQGDTLSEIADRFNVDEDNVAAINRLHDRDTLVVGQVIYVPAYGRVAQSRPPHRPGNTKPAYRAPPPKRVAQATIPRRPVRRPSPTVTHTSLPAPARPSDSSAQFVWPLDGIVVSSFGSRYNGERNDGINISCTGGEAIRAAAAGTVTYVGNELKGYGNLILIKHDNGFTSAYAHADQILVHKGDRIDEGQVIAFAGATGDVAEPQLHFELRRGVTPVDPRPYLRTYGS